MASYSNTPLAKKLGIKNGFIIALINQPDNYFDLFSDLPCEIVLKKRLDLNSLDFIHLFCKTENELIKNGLRCKKALKKTGILWISWPKGSSKIKTDLKREPIREHLLKLGLVDIKVAAIDQNWSGLKFVYRLKER
ncbi:DUF3052 domain-containing protein [Croceitalea rosinachiae]|uniref:DUF3052 domain-containing protein n=1 Tax=Croceitalea rosinachiae TaxID=3075596 RepID=A0ABU3AEQ9_9FLAO|nr:DUF3052 domain-containing protein [Croceitalea sp. F388]MDT0607573.1 DUF3052 domain-containing protein [Croceitalea sp. F388]